MSKSSPQARLAITIVVPCVLFLIGFVPLPGVDTELIPTPQTGLLAAFNLPPRNLSIMALGLMPVLSGFTLVELVALIVPRWSHLRLGGPDGRRKLTRASIFVAVVLALFQSWGLVRFIADLGLLHRSATGPLGTLLLLLSLVGGMCLLVVGAAIINRWGLADGFSILIAFSLLGVMGNHWFIAYAKGSEFPPRAALLPIVFTGLAAALSYRILRSARPAEARHWIPLPACGVLPLVFASELPGYAWTLERFGLELPEFVKQISQYGTWQSYVFEGLLVLVLGGLFAVLFNLPSRVKAVADQLNLPGEPLATPMLRARGLGEWRSVGQRDGDDDAEDDSDDGERAELERDADDGAEEGGEGRMSLDPDNPYAPPAPTVALTVDDQPLLSGLKRAQIASVACVLALAALAGYGHYAFKLSTDVVAIAILVAVVMDLVAEWKGRVRDELTAVWELHRVYAVPLVLHALHERGIVAYPRGFRHRTLLQFFGPFVPIRVFVPAARAKEARRFLAARLGDMPPTPATGDASTEPSSHDQRRVRLAHTTADRGG